MKIDKFKNASALAAYLAPSSPASLSRAASPGGLTLRIGKIGAWVVMEIGAGAFSEVRLNAAGVTVLILPGTITAIAPDAFTGNGGLTVVIPPAVYNKLKPEEKQGLENSVSNVIKEDAGGEALNGIQIYNIDGTPFTGTAVAEFSFTEVMLRDLGQPAYSTVNIINGIMINFSLPDKVPESYLSLSAFTDVKTAFPLIKFSDGRVLAVGKPEDDSMGIHCYSAGAAANKNIGGYTGNFDLITGWNCIKLDINNLITSRVENFDSGYRWFIMEQRVNAVPENYQPIYDDADGGGGALASSVNEKVDAHPVNISDHHNDFGTVNNGQLMLNPPTDNAFINWVRPYLEDNFYGYPLPNGAKFFWACLGVTNEVGGLLYVDIGADIKEVAHVYFTGPARIYGRDGGGNSVDIIVHAGWNQVYCVEKSDGTTMLTTNLLNLPSGLKWRLYK